MTFGEYLLRRRELLNETLRIKAELRASGSAAGNIVRPICDRFWLFTIAFLGLSILGGIVFAISFSDKDLDPERMALLTSIGTGLLMLIQKVIEAQGTRRLTEQLHQSRPAAPDGEPQPVEVVNDVEHAVPVIEENVDEEAPDDPDRTRP